ncbi:hypothetical protein [Streptomyces atratus]|uniref:hypothetical protein n=1 Tax=Streptomyces atratus TaxID=1893 RepID=UPI0018E4EAA6|nr:hypothetical protein [Streptomyces atratus]
MQRTERPGTKPNSTVSQANEPPAGPSARSSSPFTDPGRADDGLELAQQLLSGPDLHGGARGSGRQPGDALGSFCRHELRPTEAARSQNVEYPTPSRAEGWRLEGNMDPAEAQVPRRVGERLAEHAES